MSSDKQYGAITPSNTSGSEALTVLYGDDTIGWTTPGIDVSGLDFLLLELAYTHASSGAPATVLTIQPQFGERDAASLDDYCPELEDPTASGALTDLAKTVDVTGLADAEVLKRVIRFDTRAASMLRLAAKADVITDGPTLSVRYMGGGRARPLVAAPAIPAV